jgi:hypothetical protein
MDKEGTIETYIQKKYPCRFIVSPSTGMTGMIDNSMITTLYLVEAAAKSLCNYSVIVTAK